MDISVTFRHMEATEALKEYARQRLDRFRKYLRRPMECHITFSVERHWHIADVTLRVEGITIRGEERTHDMYSSVDAVVDKLETQIRKYKDKLRDHHSWESPPPSDHWLDVSVVQPFSDADEHGTAELSEPMARISHTERVPAEPMSLDHAVMRMDLSQDPVMVFTHADDGVICVLYRRDDGTYGFVQAAGASDGKAAGASAPAEAAQP